MSNRKTDHIALAALSAPATANADSRFYYEPLLSGHPSSEKVTHFLGKEMKHPLWISSMTGGYDGAYEINTKLAEACAEFQLGMGLGSCRSLLESEEYFNDFNLRPILGPGRPFFANIGIAQLEKIIQHNELARIHDLVGRLQCDGLIIHVNPVQEWLQPEGDRFVKPPVEVIAEFIDMLKKQYLIIVKEVGQGMGPESIRQLLKLKIDAIEFGAFGGTNFANIEIMRNPDHLSQFLFPMATFGHNTDEMLSWVNDEVFDHSAHCKNLIISGGIRNYLDGYYYIQKSTLPALYGMANVLLQHAMASKDDLFSFIKAEIEGYKFASRFLSVRE
ncbi:MAG: type 2 isopentenyl-diphosphate Delta-isomerase [Prolixibacteraceae bacterium]|nr:type 2 isopentenyl-diphosphate Delta-isomerase [Prolixibacteraceae bacterium]